MVLQCLDANILFLDRCLPLVILHFWFHGMDLNSVVFVGGCLFQVRLVSPTVSDKEAFYLLSLLQCI